METQLQYVLRMLDKPEINITAAALAVKTSTMNLYNLKKRKDGKAKLVQELSDYFKSLNQ